MNIYPSLMVVPEQDLKKEIQLLAPHCAGFHIDIMDGIFVPNNMWYNPEQVNEIVRLAQKVWIHLMVQKPEPFYSQLELPHGSLVSFHIESDIDIFIFAKIIKEKKQRASMAISPKTAIKEIIPFLNVVDHVLIMSVEPGFSGQPFLEKTYEKIDELVAYRKKYKVNFDIGVDGGINKNNINSLVLQGIDDVAVGGGIFQHKDPIEALQDLRI